MPSVPESETVDAGPLGELPRLHGRQLRVERWLNRHELIGPWRETLAWLDADLDSALRLGPPEVRPGPAGLSRPGVNVHLSWPRLGTRLALGFETSLAHALVDRLLGFERSAGEDRLAMTPVEWGIWTYVAAQTLARLEWWPCALGAWDVTLDRVSPDAFDPQGLGSLVTIRWPVKIGDDAGSARLWIPESLLGRWLAIEPVEPPPDRTISQPKGLEKLASTWVAEVGTIPLPRGLGRLRVGGVLPLDPTRLTGTIANPSGRVELAIEDGRIRYVIPAEPVPHSGGGRVRLTALLQREPIPREPLPVSTSSTAPEAPAPPPADVPVTLTVELGRLQLPISRLADLKPGDVLELGRHAREPVELTSNGRLVARGELVQIDTELGVRIQSLFF